MATQRWGAEAPSNLLSFQVTKGEGSVYEETDMVVFPPPNSLGGILSGYVYTRQQHRQEQSCRPNTCCWAPSVLTRCISLRFTETVAGAPLQTNQTVHETLEHVSSLAPAQNALRSLFSEPRSRTEGDIRSRLWVQIERGIQLQTEFCMEDTTALWGSVVAGKHVTLIMKATCFHIQTTMFSYTSLKQFCQFKVHAPLLYINPVSELFSQHELKFFTERCRTIHWSRPLYLTDIN